MKKLSVVLFVCGVLFICSCTNTATPAGTDTEKTDIVDDLSSKGEESEMDAHNRRMMASALGVEEDNDRMRFYLNALNTIEAGQLKKAEVREENGKKVIRIIAEDDTEYDIYLSANDGLDSIKNLTTGEWPVRSVR